MQRTGLQQEKNHATGQRQDSLSKSRGYKKKRLTLSRRGAEKRKKEKEKKRTSTDYADGRRFSGKEEQTAISHDCRLR